MGKILKDSTKKKFVLGRIDRSIALVKKLSELTVHPFITNFKHKKDRDMVSHGVGGNSGRVIFNLSELKRRVKKD